MNKEVFLRELGKRLPHRGRALRSILHFYGEMIDDLIEEGNSEEEAVARIGTVEETASGIIADGAPLGGEERGRASRAELLLLILGAPLWGSLLLVGGAVSLALGAVLWSLITVLWALEIPFYICAMISKYLLLGCREATKGASALTAKCISRIRRLFPRRNSRI